MRWIGQFREFDDDPSSPLMADRLGTAGESQAATVAAYLRSGYGVIDVVEMRSDVIDGSEVRATASVLSDGNWMWREDLAYYVEKYRLDLGAEFGSTVSQGMRKLDHSALRDVGRDAIRLWTGRD